MNIDQWTGCYPSNWKGVIVEEAMSHPAKYSSKLIRRIYKHLMDEGWVEAGDRVIDPFGGVALGAFDAMRLGLDWVGVELEERFHKIGNDNIHLWGERYGEMPTWGTARLLHGDSRKLNSVISDQSPVVSVSSPPFTDSLSTDLLPREERRARARELGISNVEHISPIDMEKIGMRHQSDYGITAGQLGAMKADGFQAAISSPPFLQSNGGTHEPKPGGVIDHALYARHAAGNASANVYGETAGQLGTESGDDFWLAAREIVEQVYQALTPGGHACWVVKDYVKNKKVVPFCDQWRQLCEAVGFETLHEHHAMLVHGRQMMLDGGVHVKESKSFFRRLAEKNGSPRIDFEVVLCMVKWTRHDLALAEEYEAWSMPNMAGAIRKEAEEHARPQPTKHRRTVPLGARKKHESRSAIC
jgi:hypothetical protein